MSNLRRSVSKNIKLHRIRLGMTQETLAKKMRVEKQYISKVERTQANLTLKMLELFAKSLGIPPVLLIDDSNFERNPALEEELRHAATKLLAAAETLK